VLAELRIRDFAIIDELQLSLARGFVVLTGETGAGKSILIDAVDLLLGGRADSAVIRAGADRALIEAVFRLGTPHRARVDALLAREGLEGDDPHLLLIGREVRLNGRNVCRVNGRTVTLGLLQELTEGLVDIHGQSEHLSLRHAPEQVNLLDRYAGAWALRARVSGLVQRVRDVRRELTDLLQRDRELAHRADLLEFQIGEITAAGLKQTEEDELLAERVRLANAEQLATLASEALAALEEGEAEMPSLVDLLGTAQRALEALTHIDATLLPQSQLAEGLGYQVEELINNLRDYRDQIEYSPRRLRAVEDRLALIHRLERKYGATIADMLEYAEQASHELDAIAHSEERIEELREEETRLLAELATQASALSTLRREAAQRLAAGIERELRDLRMEGARFGVAFEWREDDDGLPLSEETAHFTVQATSGGIEPAGQANHSGGAGQRIAFDASGMDHVDFLVSPNPGEPLKPMARIASGGETSRLMLALKAVLAQADETPTLVFDEIDQGIGGRVGATVGQKLWTLTRRPGRDEAGRQVLCVTHLPQLAGFGDQHLHVEKVVRGERTVTRVRPLGGDERVQEIAAMLGPSGEAAYRSAEEILELVANLKRDESGIS
jgi:DNA repair protein RecN (Recombination protein N)